MEYIHTHTQAGTHARTHTRTFKKIEASKLNRSMQSNIEKLECT